MSILPETVTACRHHWLIETPSGATSRGRCKRCGARHAFVNASDDKWIVPPKKDVRLIARAKREEAAINRLITGEL